MSDFLKALYEEMAKDDLAIVGEVKQHVQGKQRFRGKNHRKGKDIFVFVHGGGDGASFGDWHDQSTWRTWWLNNWKDLSQEERFQRKQQMEMYKEEQAKERVDAVKEARRIFATAKKADIDHPYLIKKCLYNTSHLWQIDDKLVIPVYDWEGEIQSLQYITETGFKYFHPGTSALYGHGRIGDVFTEPTYICEGYATASTIHQVMDATVFIAFTAHNLHNVAYGLRMKKNNCFLSICADNDIHLPNNVGVEMAQEAANICGGMLFIPKFKEFYADEKPTDFNDLLKWEGSEEVYRQLMRL